MLVAALLATLLPRQGDAAGVGDADDLIAFCRPLAGAADAAPSCICSAEQVEQPLTPGEFLRHMRERRATGATSAAELRAAARHAREACGGEATFATPAGARGAMPCEAEPPAERCRGGRMGPTGAWAP